MTQLVNTLARCGILADRIADAFTELLQEPLRRDRPHEFETVEVLRHDSEYRLLARAYESPSPRG